MTMLTLNKVWINRLDSGEAISGASGRGREQSFEMEINVRTYASGRRRAVGTIGEIATVPFRLVAVDLATKEKLRTWKGLAVQVRDNRMQKWFGIFRGVQVTEYMRPDLYAVAFTLELTTVVEGL